MAGLGSQSSQDAELCKDRGPGIGTCVASIVQEEGLAAGGFPGYKLGTAAKARDTSSVVFLSPIVCILSENRFAWSTNADGVSMCCV